MGEFGRGFPCQCSVGSILVIERPLRGDFAPSVGQEPVLVQTPLPQTTVEAFHHSVVGGRATAREVQLY